MGRWTQYDEDEYRLPEGMKRVGYDADTQRYYFKDSSGRLWEGAQGAQFSEMRKVTTNTVHFAETDNEDVEARPDGYQPLAVDAESAPHKIRPDNNTNAYRTLFPFLMMVIVALLLVLRLVAPHTHDEDPVVTLCSGFSHAYRIEAGDTCWDIAHSRGLSVNDLLDVNPGLDCKLLTPSEIICLPESKTPSTSSMLSAARRR